MSMAKMTKSLEPLKGREFEIAFLTEMISLHVPPGDAQIGPFAHVTPGVEPAGE